MEKYKCDICGKNHNVFRSLESPLPELIREIPEKERESRIKTFNGFHIIDEKWFLGSGDICIEMEGMSEPIFYWQVWSTISTIDYKKYLEDLKDGKRVELKGVLQSEIPFYPKSTGLKTKVIMQVVNEISVEIQIAEESRIKKDQSKPISKERVIELMQFINHHELFRNKKEFDKPFSDRLSEELIYAKKHYLKKKKNFVINISSPKNLLFQIVSSNMLESAKNSNLGFGLYLSFDKSFEESIEEIEKFKKQNYSKIFEYHDVENIPTYQIDMKKDNKKIERLVIQLIKDVYDCKVEDIEINNHEV